MTVDRRPRSPGCPTRYYAPEFVVEVEGEALDPASKGDVLELKVEMDLEGARPAST